MRLIKQLTKPTNFTAVDFGHLVSIFKIHLHFSPQIFYLGVTFQFDSSCPSTLEILKHTPQLEWALLACRNMTRIFNEANKFQSSDKFMLTHDTVAK